MAFTMILLMANMSWLRAAEPPPLPSANQGLAAKYPGDQGIADDPRVVFVENFEASLDQIRADWDNVQSPQTLSLDLNTPDGSRGRHSLLVTHIGGQGTGAHLYRRLAPGYDRLHYRFYVRFSQDCAPIHHFFHVGGYNPLTAWPQGGAGTRPQGDERFSTGVEPHGASWRWDFYSYWMEMGASPPRGQCWGNSFLRDTAPAVTRGQWQCLELMMKLNDVGQSNGEMALWLDGKLVSHMGPGYPRGKWIYDKFIPGEGGEGLRWNDKRGEPESLKFTEGGDPFAGFRWRSDENLQLNILWLLCYITKAETGHVSQIWFDDIVVAQDYIGPLFVSPR